MRVRSAYNVNWKYEPAPLCVDKCQVLTPNKICIEANPRTMTHGRDYIAWCEYPKINKEEFERVKREYQGK